MFEPSAAMIEDLRQCALVVNDFDPQVGLVINAFDIIPLQEYTCQAHLDNHECWRSFPCAPLSLPWLTGNYGITRLGGNSWRR